MKKNRGVVHERSAGAVVYHSSDKGREFLLLRYGAGHWGFPKGHVERGETDEQAATREVAEEASIAPHEQKFVPGFREDTIYNFQRGRTRVDKQVCFFLVESSTRDVRISHEHTDHVWLPYARALEQLTFEGPRRVLMHAEDHLRRLEGRDVLEARDGHAGAPEEPGTNSGPA